MGTALGRLPEGGHIVGYSTCSRARTIIAIACAFFVFGPVAGPAAGQALPVDTTETLLAKADAGLVDAVRKGNTQSLDVIVTGPAHVGFTQNRFSDRAAAMRAMESASQPFFTEVERVALAAGGRVVTKWAAGPAVKVSGTMVTAKALAALKTVQYMERDYEGAVRLVEPIPDPGGIEASNSDGRKMLQAEDIWALGFKGEGIKVTIIDTGLDPNHEALKNADGSTRIAKWVDYSNNRVTPYDDHGHGTHVAGTSVGASDYVDPQFGAFQETGVAPKATLYGAKFLNSAGSGSFENGINSLTWSYNEGADISSNSWGSTCSSSSSAVMRTVRQLTDLGMLSVFAAGNSGPGAGSVGGPACSDSALSVAAVDKNSVIASFSSRGPCADLETGGPSRICPDVAAKGVAVRSSIPRSGAGNSDPSGYKTWQGTSMATPHIAGAVALAEQMKKQFTGAGWDTPARAEEQVFKLTALDLGTAGEDNTFGWGLPQLLSIYALLNATDEAKIIDTFGISSPLVRLGDSTKLSFTVRNLGGARATGPFRATLTSPSGAETVLKSADASLGLLDGQSVSHTMTVGGDISPGTWTFRGTFAYTWTDPDGIVHDGLVDRVGTIDVKRVFMSMQLTGLEAKALPGSPQALTFTATNTGNEDASGVLIEFTVPDRYKFVPGDNFDPAVAQSRFAAPTPKKVTEDGNYGRVVLSFEPGNLPVGQQFTFTTKLLPTSPDDYRLLAVTRFKDGAGKAFFQGGVFQQTVGL
ncbi:MAG TPA: S8 family serine peptidase [Actinomycetota bacterium]|nr:S8 family serine peptidase [Actinomycetota bacterium]